MPKASASDREYFRRVAAANERLELAKPPAFLEEVFERLEYMEDRLTGLGHARGSDPGGGDLASHLAYLERLRRIDPTYGAR